MRYQNAKRKKLNKIADFVQYEVKIGKCDRQDIEDMICFIRATVLPYDEYMTAKREATEA
jgi:hypothetical protein